MLVSCGSALAATDDRLASRPESVPRRARRHAIRRRRRDGSRPAATPSASARRARRWSASATTSRRRPRVPHRLGVRRQHHAHRARLHEERRDPQHRDAEHRAGGRERRGRHVAHRTPHLAPPPAAREPRRRRRRRPRRQGGRLRIQVRHAFSFSYGFGVRYATGRNSELRVRLEPVLVAAQVSDLYRSTQGRRLAIKPTGSLNV